MENTLKNINETFECLEGVNIDKENKNKIYDYLENKTIEILPDNNKGMTLTVLATMSSGKSTVINALIGKKLMPSKNEACTAIVTKIKHNKKNDISLKIYYKKKKKKKKKKSKKLNIATFKDIENLNNNKNVLKLELKTNLHFIQNEIKTNLILVDTPGPNNSMDKSHKQVTYDFIDENPNNKILYILNATQLGVSDDKLFLQEIIKKLEEKGINNLDNKFIFILNKLDTFRKDNDNVLNTINNAKCYLKEIGINNPIVFPLSAMLALGIKTFDTIEDEEFIEDIEFLVKKFIKNEELHFENYTKEVLTPSTINKLNSVLENGNSFDIALVHSGIISLQEYLKYLNNYY